jgi:hypothetical protein
MFVHGAKFTAVPGAASRDADQGAVGLVGRPEGRKVIGNLFKMHGPIKVKDFSSFINSQPEFHCAGLNFAETDVPN